MVRLTCPGIPVFHSQKCPTEGYHIPGVYLPCQQKKHMYLCIVLFTYVSLRKPEILLVVQPPFIMLASQNRLLSWELKHYIVSFNILA